MKLQQLRYLAAVVQNGLNVTTAAQALHTSQPGVSKQIRLLEEELGLTLCVRDGRALKRLTPAGEELAARALRMLREAQALKSLAKDLKHSDRGSLSIGTTHTQARQPSRRSSRGPRTAHAARGAGAQVAGERPQAFRPRVAVDRHHAHAGALRAAARDPRFPPEIPRRAAAPAPGYERPDRRDGVTRPHRLRHQ